MFIFERINVISITLKCEISMSNTFLIITSTVFSTWNMAINLWTVRITSYIVVCTIFFFGSLDFCGTYVVAKQIQINQQNSWQGVVYFSNPNYICININMIISPNFPISTLTRMCTGLISQTIINGIRIAPTSQISTSSMLLLQWNKKYLAGLSFNGMKLKWNFVKIELVHRKLELED